MESDSPQTPEASLRRSGSLDRPGGRASHPTLRAFLPLVSTSFVAVACVSAHSTIAPYRDDPDAAAEIEDRAAIRCLDRTATIPPHSFTTDGCSVFPDGDWQACCVEHDLDYWCGGPSSERKRADLELAACVARAGHPLLGPAMRAGVRLGGAPWWPWPWRWGYGWDYPHGYDPEPATDISAGFGRTEDRRRDVASDSSPVGPEPEGSPD
ncbi:MAG TPA: hypothetical protein ENI85_13925 [Deltaproteobacteria bacterium]|nr:hypothetical protein [Deltaproteobacteria bacterium]